MKPVHKRSPSFPYYAKDHITTFAQLNMEQRGAWVTLVSHIWWEGPITEEHAQRLVGEKRLQSVRFLTVDRSGRITFDWIEETRKKKRHVSDINAVNGALGGRGNRRGRRRKSERSANATDPLTEKKPSRAGKGKGKSNTVRGKVPAPATPFPYRTTEAIIALHKFEDMRSRTGKPLTEPARSMIFADLAVMGEADAIRSLNKSTRAGWPDVYPPTGKAPAPSVVAPSRKHTGTL